MAIIDTEIQHRL